MTRVTTVSALLACASLLVNTAGAQPKASAGIVDAAGKKVGEAILEQRGGSVQISVTFTDLYWAAAGPPCLPHSRDRHIHEIGKCDQPFESAGGHFNPTGKQHGKDNPNGPHAGDLPNLGVPAGGRVKVDVTVKDISLEGGRAGLHSSMPTAPPCSYTRAPTTTNRIPLATPASVWPVG
jgi:Cu-Zn family superoxide dismutase